MLSADLVYEAGLFACELMLNEENAFKNSLFKYAYTKDKTASTLSFLDQVITSLYAYGCCRKRINASTMLLLKKELKREQERKHENECNVDELYKCIVSMRAYGSKACDKYDGKIMGFYINVCKNCLHFQMRHAVL